MPEVTVRVVVEGQVQGVGYRAWAVREARGLGLRGWVRNRRDGSVEVLATGAAAAVEAMIAACARGPRQAQVARITRAGASDDGSGAFHERATA